MTTHPTLRNMGAGAVAGLAGSMVIQGLQTAGQRKIPENMPPIREHPGEFMVKKAEEILGSEMRRRIRPGLEKAAAQMLGVGYGVTFGTIFALMLRKPHRLFGEGTLLGLATWAAGYLGWLPAAGLMPRVTRQKPGQVVEGIVSHVAFGIATAGAYRLIRRGSASS